VDEGAGEAGGVGFGEPAGAEELVEGGGRRRFLSASFLLSLGDEYGCRNRRSNSYVPTRGRTLWGQSSNFNFEARTLPIRLSTRPDPIDVEKLDGSVVPWLKDGAVATDAESKPAVCPTQRKDILVSSDIAKSGDLLDGIEDLVAPFGGHTAQVGGRTPVELNLSHR